MPGTTEKIDGLLAGRFFHLGLVIVLAVLLTAAYSNSFNAAFQFDDIYNITDNLSLHNVRNIPNLLASQRGLTKATFALNYAAGGTEVFGYHLVNFAIHLVNGCLAYLFMLLTLRLSGFAEPRARLVAAFTALFFSLHPVQTQGVTYIVQRMESLSSLFMLLAMVLFIKASACVGARRWALFALVGLSYLLGFYSKEIAYTLPALILLFDLFFTSGGRIKGVLKKWPVYAVLSVLFVIFTINTVVPIGGFGDLSADTAVASVQERASGASAAGQEVEYIPGTNIPRARSITAGFSMELYSPSEYLYTQFNVMVYYLSLLAFPANQNIEYDFPISYGLFSTPEVRPGTVLNIPIPPAAVSLAILLAIVAAAIILAARSFKDGGRAGRVVAFFIFWYFIILAPTSSFIPIADVIFEHRIYLPSLGAFAVFAVSVEWLAGRLLAGSGDPGCRGQSA